MTYPQHLRVLEVQSDLPPPVLEVLAGERAERRPTLVRRPDPRREIDLPPQRADPVVELIVLVPDEPLVVESRVEENLPRVGAQIDGIHVLRRAVTVESQSSHTKCARCYPRDNLAPVALSLGDHRAPDALRPALPERLEHGSDVVARDAAVTVDPDDDVTTGCANADVHPRRHDHARVIDEPHSGISRGDLTNYLPR